jgi:hypothetical protein
MSKIGKTKMKNFQVIKQEWEHFKNQLNLDLETRLEEVVKQLTKSGIKADDYTLGSGTWYLGEVSYYHSGDDPEASMIYDLYELVSHSSDYNDCWVQIDDFNNSQLEESEQDGIDYPLYPVITKEQFDLLKEFDRLCNGLSYGIWKD